MRIGCQAASASSRQLQHGAGAAPRRQTN